jgi:hypothetical protein
MAKRIALAVLVLLAFAGPSFAKTDRDQDDGVLVRQVVVFNLDPDGRLTRHEESAVEMLTAWVPQHGLLDPRINWNEARSEMTVDRARTVMKNGKVVDAKPNSFVPNTAPELQWAVPYAAMRQMVVSHVGVEHGSVSTLAFTVRDRKPSGVPLWGVIELQGQVPVREQQIEFRLPETIALKWAGVNTAPRLDVTTREGHKIHTLSRRDVPAANLAELPSGRAGVQRLVYSTASDWAAVRSFLEKRVESASSPDAAVQAKTEELLEGAVLDAEKIARLHAFVVDGIQTVSWPLVDFDYAVRPAGEVLASSVGHPLDKAVLLAAMLRAAGVRGTISLVSSEREIAQAVPSPAQLDEAWVRCETAGKVVWMDPTALLDKRNRFHVAGHWALPLDGSATTPEVLPELDPSTNRASLRITAKIARQDDALEVAGTIDIDVSGLYNPVVAVDRGSERARALVAGVASAFGAAKVKDVVIGYQNGEATSLRGTFSDGRLPVSRSGLVRLALPRTPAAVRGDALQMQRQSRTLPLVVPAPASERVEVVLELPKDVEIAYLPLARNLDNPVGSLRRTIRKDGTKTTVSGEMTLRTAVVKPDRYSALRDVLSATESDADRMVLLKVAD